MKNCLVKGRVFSFYIKQIIDYYIQSFDYTRLLNKNKMLYEIECNENNINIKYSDDYTRQMFDKIKDIKI